MNRLEKVILYFFIAITIVISYYAVKSNGFNHFIDINIGQVLSIVVIGIVLFNITNIVSARSKKKEIFLMLTEKLQKNLNNDRLVLVESDEDVAFIRLRIRKIANIINCLKSMNMKNKKVKECLAYIEEKFDEYETVTSEYINDIDFLKKSHIILQNHIERVNSKCDEMIVELYK